MDLNLFLTISGIIISLAFGIIGITLTIKRKYKGKIDLIVEKNINLYDSIVKNIEDLKVLYKNKPIEENMNLINVLLINTGAKDSSKENTERFPSISFGENSIIHNVNIISKSEQLNIENKIQNNTIIIESGLFRCNEYIYFEILVETQDKIQADEAIQINYRISDFDEPKPLFKSKLNKNFNRLIAVFVGVLFGFGPAVILDTPLSIDIYDLNAKVVVSDSIIELDYFDYNFALNDKDGIPRATLKKIEVKAKDIAETYNYFNFIFNSKQTEFVIDNYNVRFIYQKSFSLVYVVLFIIFSIILFGVYFKNKQTRQLSKMIDSILEDKNTTANNVYKK